MSIEYIETLNTPNSLKKHAIIDLDDLCLDKRNPRFSSSTIMGKDREINESDIIGYLLMYGKISELAESINRNHGLYDEEWISCYINDANEIIVLEGNRRVAACKVLKNESLVPQNIKNDIYIPSVDKEKTLPNISKVKAIIYKDENDAQNYIAAKHTKPEIMKWETIEQCNYYYEQFTNGKSPIDIAQNVNENAQKVREKIRQFSLFKKVFDVVKSEYPHVLIEGISILPLVTKFFPPLISPVGIIGLALSYDDETLTYSASPEKEDIFNKILLKIGEAFFVRSKLNGMNTSDRNGSDTYRISTDEIKSKNKVEKLILDDVRIPGLYSLIKKYKGCDSKSCLGEDNSKKISDPNRAPSSTPNSNKDDGCNSNSGSSAPTSNTTKLAEFFSDIKYSHINKSDSLGVVLICEEIQRISSYYGGSAYKQFPIASAFLLRSLIEQVLSKRLMQMKRYDSMVKTLKGGYTRSPELGAIIEVFLKDYQNKNLSLFWDDGNLGKEFNKCFSGYGTKDQLDTIIHNPHLIQPDQNFLNSLSKQGLKLVIQEFLNHF